jgi:hypothetical protein
MIFNTVFENFSHCRGSILHKTFSNFNTFLVVTHISLVYNEFINI